MKKIAIMSVPRSGSSWLGKTFSASPTVEYRFQPNFSYSFPYSISKTSSEIQIDEFFRELHQTTDPFVLSGLDIDGQYQKNQEIKASNSTLVWKEVHALDLAPSFIEGNHSKIIGLIRNPLAVLNSWSKAPREFHREWNIEDEWMHAEKKNNENPGNYFGFMKWVESTRMFLNLEEQFPHDLKIVFYDDLLADPFQEIQALFKWSGIPFSSQVRDFILDSKSKSSEHAYSVYNPRVKDDDWIKHLPPKLVAEIREELIRVDLSRLFKI